MVKLFSNKNNTKAAKDDNNITVLYDRYIHQLDILRKKMECSINTETVSGTVIAGSKIRSNAGIPTANIYFNSDKLKNGFYCSKFSIDNNTYDSVTLIDAKKNMSETYIFNFKQNIYGKKANITLIHFLSNLLDTTQVSLEQQFQNNINSAFLTLQ